jgi:protein-tyrosine phosphatase
MKAIIYPIDGPWPGRLTILPRPRGGDWLEDEVQAWRQAGVNTVVSALEANETEELGLAAEGELAQASGIEFVSYPIPDRGVPGSIRTTADLVRRLEMALGQGNTVAFHCRQGIGRSAILAACLLVLAGLDPAKAFERIAAARGCSVPDTQEQRNWVARFGR